MNALRNFLKAMPPEQQEQFAKRIGTSLGYLRKAISVQSRFSEGMAINIERESGGAVTVEELRPDLAPQWAYIRGTAKRQPTEQASA